MSANYIKSQIKYPDWCDDRYRRLDFYLRFLEGRAYDHIIIPFFQEADNQGRYIPLRSRQPSVIYNLPRIVVTRSTRLLFGDKHFPKFVTPNKPVNEFLQKLIDQCNLQATMLEAAHVGSIGSVLVLVQVVDGNIQFDVVNPCWCLPKFDKAFELEEVLIRYPTYGYALAALGYDIEDTDYDSRFIFAKRITKQEEILYAPVLEADFDIKELRKDPKRSVEHGLGLFPGVWIKNLMPSVGYDGACTFGEILSLNVELDYQLSQCGRGLKYNSDPQLLIKEPAGTDSGGEQMPPTRTTSNAIFVGSEGDAKLLEISGQGQKAVLEYCKQLRQYALEVVSSSRKDPEHAYGNMSGRGMEILEGDLISLSAAMRLTYGEIGLKKLVLKVMEIAKKAEIPGVPALEDDLSIQLYWGNWFDPTPVDLFQTEQALDFAVRGRRMYMHEGRELTATTWNIGHGNPAKLEEEWPIPPKPDIDLVEPAKPAKSGAAGNDGRD